MDLDDSFTNKLLKRRKARKDYLKVKMMDSPARVKKTVLVEEQQIPSEDNKELNESLKYLCIEQVSLEHKVKEGDLVEEVKENVSVKQQEMRMHSAQDHLNDKKASRDTQQTDKPPTSVFSTNRRELCSTRNRLARLAADINSWEDNLMQPTAFATSSTQKAPASAAEEVEDTLNCSFEPSNLPLSARRALFEQAAMENEMQSKRQTFKPKVSVAQRAAMFENAPKNEYRFRTTHQKPANKSSVKPTMKVGSPVKPATALSHAQSSAVLKGSHGRQSAALIRTIAKPSTGSPAKSSPAFDHVSSTRPSAALTKNPTKPSTGSPDKSSSISSCNSPVESSPTFSCDSPAKSSSTFSWDSPTRPSAALIRNPTKRSTESPAKSSPTFSFDSPAKSSSTFSWDSPTRPSSALIRNPKPSTGNPARSSPTSSWDSPTKPSATLIRNPTKASTRSPAKLSPAFRRGSPAKLGANGGSTTTPTKSFIPKPIMSPIQRQWSKTTSMKPEKKQPFSSLVDHWEKLSSVTNSQSKEVAKNACLSRFIERFEHAEI